MARYQAPRRGSFSPLLDEVGRRSGDLRFTVQVGGNVRLSVLESYRLGVSSEQDARDVEEREALQRFSVRKGRFELSRSSHLVRLSPREQEHAALLRAERARQAEAMADEYDGEHPEDGLQMPAHVIEVRARARKEARAAVKEEQLRHFGDAPEQPTRVVGEDGELVDLTNLEFRTAQQHSDGFWGRVCRTEIQM